MDLSANSPGTTWLSAFDSLNNVFRGSTHVRCINNILRTLRMHHDRDPAAISKLRPHLINMLRPKHLVNAAVPRPQQDPRGANLCIREPALVLLWVPQRSLRRRARACIKLRHKSFALRSIAPKVLIRQEENLHLFALGQRRIATRKCPVKHLRSIGTGAARTALRTNKGLDRSA